MFTGTEAQIIWLDRPGDPGTVLRGGWDFRHFKPAELADPTTGVIGMNAHFMECLANLRERYGKPIIVNSGFRGAEHNRAIGGAPHSQHLYGRAADLHIPRADLYRVVHIAQLCGMTGIGIRAALGDEHTHDELHVDVGAITPPGYDGKSPRPRLWTYQRRRT